MVEISEVEAKVLGEVGIGRERNKGRY